jgi:hypothetical protein
VVAVVVVELLLEHFQQHQLLQLEPLVLVVVLLRLEIQAVVLHMVLPQQMVALVELLLQLEALKLQVLEEMVQ